jgi:hypothetical protein
MSRYVNWFIKKTEIAKYLLDLELFPNSKEIEESYGMFHCCIAKLNFNTKNDKILCIVVGDGAKPRTACTISYNSKWTSISIDPILKKLKTSIIEKLKNTKRVEYIPEKIENINFTKDYKYFDNIVFIHPHSHALLSNTLIASKTLNINKSAKIWLISMPCCVHDDLNLEYYSYVDNMIHSPKNRINIYSIKNTSIGEINY